jgi:hypothetical protein
MQRSKYLRNAGSENEISIKHFIFPDENVEFEIIRSQTINIFIFPLTRSSKLTSGNNPKVASIANSYEDNNRPFPSSAIVAAGSG